MLRIPTVFLIQHQTARVKKEKKKKNGKKRVDKRIMIIIHASFMISI